MMSASCRTLAIDQVTTGMILGADVQDAGGALLLARGTSLTAAQLASLRRRGIDSVGIEATAADAEAAVDLDAVRERHRQRLAILFRRCSDQPADLALRQWIHQYRLGNGSNEQA